VAVYRQGGGAAHKRFFRFADDNIAASDYGGFIRGYENMTAVNTGTGAFPTTTQYSGDGLLVVVAQDVTTDNPTQQHRAWIVLGTPRFFVVYFESYRPMYPSNGGVRTPISSLTFGACHHIMFGELSNLAKPADTFATFCTNFQGFAFGPYVPRDVSGTGTAKQTRIVNSPDGYGKTTMSGVYPSASDGGIHFSGPVAFQDNDSPHGFRGYVPGTLCPIEAPFSNGNSTAPNVGFMVTNVSGVTGRVMLACHTGTASQDLGWLVDEDWGDV
jgi:hypothetical protein